MSVNSNSSTHSKTMTAGAAYSAGKCGHHKQPTPAKDNNAPANQDTTAQSPEMAQMLQQVLFPMIHMMQMMIQVMMSAQGATHQSTSGNTQPQNNFYDDNDSIQNAQHQLLGNRSPQLDSLLDAADHTDPESPEGVQIQTQISSIWTKNNGDPKNLSQYKLLQDIRTINKTGYSLSNIGNNIEPNSPDGQALQARMNKLAMMKQSDIQKMNSFNS